jgi:hypothetical protein
MASVGQPDVQVYELDYHGKSHAFFFALGNANQSWSFGPWSSDARLLYCRIANERLEQLVVIAATHVAWQGQPLLQSAPFEFFEWRKQDALTNSSPGKLSATALIEELASGSIPSSPTLNRSSSSPGPSSQGSASQGSPNQGSAPYAKTH